jgi:hypothetical protein
VLFGGTFKVDCFTSRDRRTVLGFLSLSWKGCCLCFRSMGMGASRGTYVSGLTMGRISTADSEEVPQTSLPGQSCLSFLVPEHKRRVLDALATNGTPRAMTDCRHPRRISGQKCGLPRGVNSGVLDPLVRVPHRAGTTILSTIFVTIIITMNSSNHLNAFRCPLKLFGFYSLHCPNSAREFFLDHV